MPKAKPSHETSARVPDEVLPGAGAGSPGSIPWRGWKQILWRVWEAMDRDNTSLLAAGVAFNFLLALVPLAAAGISLFGMFFSPQTVEAQLRDLLLVLPEDAGRVVEEQLKAIAGRTGSELGWAAASAIVLSLWWASAGTRSLMSAFNVVYGEVERRSFLRARFTAYLLTLAMVLMAGINLVFVAVVPAVLNLVQLGQWSQSLLEMGRWPLLAAIMLLTVAVLCRFAPCRAEPRWQWVSWGAVFTTLIWLGVSVGFSLYVRNFGKYDKVYGSLAGVVLLMLWLSLTMFAILLGATLNAQMEHQTTRDTTEGKERPMGERGAFRADTYPLNVPERFLKEGEGGEPRSRGR